MVRQASRKAVSFSPDEAAQLDPEILKRCAADRWFSIETMLKISNKKGELVPCKVPDLVRAHLDASGEIALMLKGRQQFLTSSCDAMFYEEMVAGEGINVLALNLTDKKAQENLKRVLDFDQFRHPSLKELTHSHYNATEGFGYVEPRCEFKSATIKNDSTPAQADLIGRTGSYRRVRWTEAAFSRHYRTVKRALLDTMPRNNRKLVIETTGNGAQGGFYEDFMEVVTHGQPHPTLANCWVFGNVTAHFMAWLQHHEYFLEKSSVEPTSLPSNVRDVLLGCEAEHRKEMIAAGLTPDEIERRVNWMRLVLVEEKGLLTDPEGAVKNFNREYPANYRHAFQATGSCWFSLNRIDSLREFFKKENERRNLPLRFKLLSQDGKEPKPMPGNEIEVFELPEKGWKNRYLGALDVASGEEDSDKAAGGIFDRYLMKWVAVFHGALTPYQAAACLMGLGMYYDWALLAWENNSLGLGVTEYLLEHSYPNLWKEYPDSTNVMDYGWHTGPESRKLMTGEAKILFEHPRQPMLMPYLPFYAEASAFQVPPGKTKPEAITGAHDDLVMMYCIGAVVHKMMPEIVLPKSNRKAAPGEQSISALANFRRATRDRRTAGHRNF